MKMQCILVLFTKETNTGKLAFQTIPAEKNRSRAPQGTGQTTEDIPEKLKVAFEGAWEEIGGDVKLVYAKPIGVDDRIVDILLDRVKEATEGE